MKRILPFLLALLIASPRAVADEGMWLPSQIALRIADMQAKGLKIGADEIYNVNHASIKDAVVHFNGGCTGELISANGLLITNYHCGYRFIQEHSSVEHDYLRDGFWSKGLADELPNRNINVRFLVRMDDVSEQVLRGVTPDMSEARRDSLIAANGAPLIAAARQEGVGYNANIQPLYYGNQYFIWVYQTFSDVSLVGAPPSAVGKFGGDTDNWMWPRHTGDFSLFRIYADKNGNPAPYSPDNVPYRPKKHLRMSIADRQEGDFTWVYGYPGTTREYIHSAAVRFVSEVSDPNKHDLRTLRLNVQDQYMSADQAVRIQYSAKNASVSNAWKKWYGEMLGLRKMHTVERKQAFEAAFDAWAQDRPEYRGLIARLADLYARQEPLAHAADYYTESIHANEIIAWADQLRTALTSSGTTPEALDAAIAAFYKDYYLPIDRESFVLLLDKYRTDVPAAYQPDYFRDQLRRYGSIAAWAKQIFTRSALIDEARCRAMVAAARKAQDPWKLLQRDPAFAFAEAFRRHYQEAIRSPYLELEQQIELAQRSYMRAQMEFDRERTFFPDANSTLRIAYGHIEGYSPSDAIYYNPVSTLEGVMQKDNPEIFDYNIPQELRDVYAAKDYGRWEVNGTVPICFLATNHTSGGNSGSPVLNGDGDLIGINFDRVWEGTMSDIEFAPEICRNISLDMRYVLFYIDKVAHATHLLDEIEIIE